MVQLQGGPAQKRFAAQSANDGSPVVASASAEVRYDNPEHALSACAMLNGSTLAGSVICVEIDLNSKDNSKVIVTGVPAKAEWQELKDHFNQCGQVAFAQVKGHGKGKGGKGSVPAIGVVRFELADSAQAACDMLNGTLMGENTIEVKIHGGSTDKTKVQICGLPPGTEWQELKDYFAQAGTIVFADVLGGQGGNACTGEVRYDDPAHAQSAIELLNGSKLGGAEIKVIADMQSQDGSKLIVTGIPAGIEWQELKDHFSPIGVVAFCNVKGAGKGKGGGKGKGMMKGNMMNGGMMGMNNNNAMLGNAWGMLMGGGKNFGNPLGCGGGGGKGWNAGKGGGPTLAGEIRYDNPMHCQFAIGMLNGTNLNGGTISIDWDYRSQDGSKLCVSGIPAGTGWQDLKDHFATIGQVAFADVKGGKGKGKGK